MIHSEFTAITGALLESLNTVKLFLKTSTSRIQEVLAKKSSSIYSTDSSTPDITWLSKGIYDVMAQSNLDRVAGAWKYSRLPTRTFKGNRRRVGVIGSSKKIAESRVKNSFDCTVNILGCVPFGESKNGFLILDLPDFAVERNVKSEIGFVTLVTFRQRVQYAWQPLKKWRVQGRSVGFWRCTHENKY